MSDKRLDAETGEMHVKGSDGLLHSKDASGNYFVQGRTGRWEVVIVLEVYAEVTSNDMLFSLASTEYGAEPNTQVAIVDAAFPGMLPVPNEECLRQAVRTGMAINAQINPWSRFDRKNYFYADLPQGYQISQLYHPIVGEGAIEVDLEGGATKTIGVERIHLEQDAGKLMHDQHPNFSYVDLNRTGVALMEIVSRPDMRSPEEAGAYVRKLRAILRYVGSCDGNMEQGSMRADVNVSVRKPGAERRAPARDVARQARALRERAGPQRLQCRGVDRRHHYRPLVRGIAGRDRQGRPRDRQVRVQLGDVGIVRRAE